MGRGGGGGKCSRMTIYFRTVYRADYTEQSILNLGLDRGH